MRKKMGRRVSLLLVFLLCVACVPAAVLGETVVDTAKTEKMEAVAETAEGSLKIDAKSAALIDVGSGTILYEQNSHESLPPASVTKVMTMLLALEAVERGQVAMDDAVTISERAASMGGSQMFMEAGETQTVETLLKGMAICSANDACK